MTWFGMLALGFVIVKLARPPWRFMALALLILVPFGAGFGG
jgi:hypothetical protein